MTSDHEERRVPKLAVKIPVASEMASVSIRTINKAIADEELCARKVGDALIVEVSELQRWIASRPYRGRAPIECDGQMPVQAPVSRRGGWRRSDQSQESAAAEI
jgi:hypothetical protein